MCIFAFFADRGCQNAGNVVEFMYGIFECSASEDASNAFIRMDFYEILLLHGA